MFLFDTNVVSALTRNPKSPADQRMLAWAKSTNPNSTYISAITLLEIEQGILLIGRRDKRQAELMRRWFSERVLSVFKDRTLPVDTAVALRAASLHVPNPKPERDSLIAATALVHDMTVATRDAKHFAPMGVRFLDPWSP